MNIYQRLPVNISASEVCLMDQLVPIAKSALGVRGCRFDTCLTIPKALKMVPVATFLGAQYYKTSTGFSSFTKTCIAQLTSNNN